MIPDLHQFHPLLDRSFDWTNFRNDEILFLFLFLISVIMIPSTRESKTKTKIETNFLGPRVALNILSQVKKKREHN